MKKRILVTGVSGAGGSYLAEHLLATEPQAEVHGLSRWRGGGRSVWLDALRPRITVHEADLADVVSTQNAIRAAAPDVVYHLASIANVPVSWASPSSVVSTNVLGTINLFEAVLAAKIDPVIFLSGTSSMYGKVDPKNVPIKEDCPLAPMSPYGVSKAAQDMLGASYFAAKKLRVVRGRIFGYVSPRRPDLFTSAFARQVAWVEAGLATEVVHGSLDSIRSVLDVRDAVEAYRVAAEKGVPGEAYNIGTGEKLSVGDFLQTLIKRASKPIKTRLDPALVRPADVTDQVPDVSKFTRETGWKPARSVADSVDFLLAYWRSEAESVARQNPRKGM